MIAANNKLPTPFGSRWTRAKERRHFRGDICVKAVLTLKNMYPEYPEKMVYDIIGDDVRTMRAISGRAKRYPLFGDWIGFKVADMIDRVFGIPVNFDQAAVFMFADPTKAALMLWRKKYNLAETAMPKDQDAVINGVVNYLTTYFKDFLAPPIMDRPVGVQEVETILCKWKSHLHGHYPLYNDIIEISEGLEPWKSYSWTAKAMLEAMPKWEQGGHDAA